VGTGSWPWAVRRRKKDLTVGPGCQGGERDGYRFGFCNWAATVGPYWLPRSTSLFPFFFFLFILFCFHQYFVSFAF
jgi:hypothetical protein